MNGSFYLKFILTVLTFSIILLGYLGISALDRLHRVNVRLLEKIEKGEFVRTAPEKKKVSAEKKISSNIANLQFFDKNAVPGGRLIRAIEAEPPNLNPIVCNEATASQMYGLCSVSLAARNWAKP
ncbi:MAG: hypothetical protein IKC05_11115, partial [Lentisphaeria bacterium]|nr:hypothetical protein [Lentisphaeria bacterium]